MKNIKIKKNIKIYLIVLTKGGNESYNDAD